MITLSNSNGELVTVKYSNHLLVLNYFPTIHSTINYEIAESDNYRNYLIIHKKYLVVINMLKESECFNWVILEPVYYLFELTSLGKLSIL